MYCLFLLVYVCLGGLNRVWVLAIISRVPPLLGFYLKWVMFRGWVFELIVLLGVFFCISGLSVLGYISKASVVCVDQGGFWV